MTDFKNTFAQRGNGETFWMPSQTLRDNDNSRRAVAQELSAFLSTYKFSEGETFNVGGHSHGGGSAIICLQTLLTDVGRLQTSMYSFSLRVNGKWGR